jgi:hypothetical protein
MWLDVVRGRVDLRGNRGLVEHGEIPGEQVDEGEGGGGIRGLDGV